MIFPIPKVRPPTVKSSDDIWSAGDKAASENKTTFYLLFDTAHGQSHEGSPFYGIDDAGVFVAVTIGLKL
jgi:hypothetical protein